MDQIHRSADGRFILATDSFDQVDSVATINRSDSMESFHSGSDDGGFLIKRGGRGRASWRRPLVISPSQLSFHSEDTGSGQRTTSRYSGGLLSIGGQLPQHLLQTVPVELHHHPIDRHMHINTISGNVPGPMVPVPYTPSRVSRIIASSPAASSVVGITSPWSPNVMYFSDLSSVQQPSSAERSFPTPQSGINQLRYLQERYSQELPSLRAIHEETKRMAQGFVPLQIEMHSPSWRYGGQTSSSTQPQHFHQHSYRQKTRLLPRYARMTRSAPDLGSPVSHLNMGMRLIEASPESRSSSSGFGSKNTSTQHNQSSQSGSTNDWRSLPPYRPPPPPPQSKHQQQQQQQLQQLQQKQLNKQTPSPITTDSQLYQNSYHYNPPSSTIIGSQAPAPQDTAPYTMGHWLELITRLNAVSEKVSIPKAVDVGSVDGHYEFDPATPTPTASTPTGPRDDNIMLSDYHFDTQSHLHYPYSHLQYHHQPTQQRKPRLSKYENIEARVQAMKEEFYAYRKRQANRHSSVELESAC